MIPKLFCSGMFSEEHKVMVDLKVNFKITDTHALAAVKQYSICHMIMEGMSFVTS